MRTFLVSAALTALCAMQASAAEDVMVNFYGNTIVATGGGTKIRVHYRADHTFDFVGSMLFISRTFKGTWALDGRGNVCRTFIGETPPDTTNPNCVPIAPRKVGDVWRSKDNTQLLTLQRAVQ